MDTLTTEQRSARMSLIRGKNTGVELTVRSLIHRLGFRYRLHEKDLPGKPDLVFSSRHKVIFIHGCFWHRHKRCSLARLPKSKLKFWVPKLEGNKLRDQANQDRLRKEGWRVMTIWECQINKQERLARRVKTFLSKPRGRHAIH
jgi:DNA mismatch endonuclease (patch repair protein)